MGRRKGVIRVADSMSFLVRIAHCFEFKIGLLLVDEWVELT